VANRRVELILDFFLCSACVNVTTEGVCWLAPRCDELRARPEAICKEDDTETFQFECPTEYPSCGQTADYRCTPKGSDPLGPVETEPPDDPI